ncbi:HAD family hydrolase [Streptomyces sp. ISL-10]|uniref:HAD family hydrolase n=1 Tax=Streptomyces sp. ISL-10 TaxID=2819172 RepID=UPI001BE79FED|nr:HAD family hydrolase [Streptomyces sp. ISL-10]MBT2364865.1 HAD family hydrolase [Streptomyces sp. ISL-10]
MLTSTPSPATRLRELFSRARLVLLDFDGPVCDLFAERSAAEIARRLCERIGPDGLRLAGLDPGVTDPLEVLLSTHRADPGDASGLVLAVRKLLAEEETLAAATAVPTSGAVPLMESMSRGGKLLGVASNNCAPAIRAHLGLHGLLAYFTDPARPGDGHRIVGRPEDPDLMKPHPYALELLLKATGTAPGDGVMIGDSPNDALAAGEAGVRFIGVHPVAAKRDALRAAGAEYLVASMHELVAAAA